MALSLLLSGTIGRTFQLEKEDPKLAIVTAVTCSVNRYCWRMDWSRRACRSSRRTWAACKTGTRTRTTSHAQERTPPAAGPGRLGPPGRPRDDGQARRNARDDHRRIRPFSPHRAERGADQSGTGRNHWGSCFSTVFAGAGIRGGQTIGTSDKIGGYPATRPFSPADLGATVYRALGIDIETTVLDRLKRPVRLCTGYEIEGTYSGRWPDRFVCCDYGLPVVGEEESRTVGRNKRWPNSSTATKSSHRRRPIRH